MATLHFYASRSICGHKHNGGVCDKHDGHRGKHHYYHDQEKPMAKRRNKSTKKRATKHKRGVVPRKAYGTTKNGHVRHQVMRIGGRLYVRKDGKWVATTAKKVRAAKAERARKRRSAAISKRDRNIGDCVHCGEKMPSKIYGETKASHKRKYHRRKGIRSKAPKRARKATSKAKWMQRAFGKHRGALHRLLKVTTGTKIPRTKLLKAKRKFERTGNTRNLRRVNAALTARKIAARRKRK